MLILYVVLVGTLLGEKYKNTLNLLISVLRERPQVIYYYDIKNKNKLVIHKVKLGST